MKINKEQHVKYFMRNGMTLEGHVQEDTASEIVLKSLDSKSLMIIHHPTQDIIMTKLVLQDDAPAEQDDSESEEEVSEPLAKEQIKEKLQEVLAIEDPDLQSLNLEELRLLVLKQEKMIIEQKRKEHFGSPGAAKVTQYSNPSFTPRPKARSNEAKSAYQPGQLPDWVRGKPTKEK